MQKGFAPILVLVGIVVVMSISGGAYYFGTLKNNPQSKNQVISQTPQSIVTSKTTLTPLITPKPTDSTKVVNKDKDEELKAEIFSYKQNPSWATYSDKVAKFTVQYPPEHKVADASIEGKEISFWNCGLNDPNRGKVCLSGFTLKVYNDYDQGSRRVWLNTKLQLYRPYYQDLIIDGKKALMAIEGNPGGSSDIFIVIPNGSMMIVYNAGMVAWDPDTSKLPDLTYHKQVLSTFKFTN